jgi:hypothetical protein
MGSWFVEKQHRRTWEVLFQVYLRTSKNGSQNPKNVSQDVTVEQAVTVLSIEAIR